MLKIITILVIFAMLGCGGGGGGTKNSIPHMPPATMPPEPTDEPNVPSDQPPPLEDLEPPPPAPAPAGLEILERGTVDEDIGYFYAWGLWIKQPSHGPIPTLMASAFIDRTSPLNLGDHLHFASYANASERLTEPELRNMGDASWTGKVRAYDGRNLKIVYVNGHATLKMNMDSTALAIAFSDFNNDYPNIIWDNIPVGIRYSEDGRRRSDFGRQRFHGLEYISGSFSKSLHNGDIGVVGNFEWDNLIGVFAGVPD